MITSYCLIRDRTIILNGEKIFSDGRSIDDFLVNAYMAKGINYPKYYKMDNLSKLGFLACELMLGGRVLADEYSPTTVAVVLSNAHASLDTDLKYAQTAKSMGSPALFVYTLSNIVAGEICIRHKIKGENAFFVTPRFDAHLLVDYVGTLNEQVQCVVCGWVDVMDQHHDVFLYLIEKNKNTPLQHAAEQLMKIYNTPLWNS